MLATLELLWEALIAVALAFWVGLLAVEGMIFGGKAQRSALFVLSRKRSQPLQWVCLSILLVAEIIMLIMRAAQPAQSPGGSAFNAAVLGQILSQPTYGYFWIAREVLIVASLGLLWWTTARAERDQPGRPVTVLASALAGLILLTYAFSPDAGQLLPQPTLLAPQFSLYADILNWFAFAAQCVWFGVLASLGYVLLSLLPTKIDVANTVTVKITDTRSGQPVTAARIVLSINMVAMDMGTVRAILVRGTPTYSATFAKDTTFSITGIWEIIVTIQMLNQAQEAVSFQIWFTG